MTATTGLHTVPTITSRVLYVLFVIDDQRRRVLHVNVTAHSIAQPLRHAFFGNAPRWLIVDNDAKFWVEIRRSMPTFGISGKRTSFRD